VYDPLGLTDAMPDCYNPPVNLEYLLVVAYLDLKEVDNLEQKLVSRISLI
jgi:hypothetical protein